MPARQTTAASPVSYTHLDVYKRQRQTTAASLMRKQRQSPPRCWKNTLHSSD
ncbi:hypothetical protein [Erwinia amylovora]